VIHQPGTLTAYVGPMAANKSANFVERVRWLRKEGYSLSVCMPAEVDAKLMHAQSRTGVSEYANRFNSALDIERWMSEVFEPKKDKDDPNEIPIRVKKALCIDEVQDAGLWLVDAIGNLIERGRTIVVAGRETDFRGEPFPIMEKLRPLADSYMVLTAVCVICGRKAERSQRLVDGKPAPWDSPVRERGGPRETYQPRCVAHHEVPGRPGG
jgi:thymidine kinase